jgi:hypothetical protein
MPLEIRTATPEDAPAACEVMRRSIAELCVPDHRNDEAILQRWLSNKTPEVFVSWIRQPDNSLLVAVEDGNILAVGAVTDRPKSPSITFRRMRDFAESAGPCSVRSKPGPESEATHDIPSQAPRRLGNSIRHADMLRTACQSATSERVLAIRWPRFQPCVELSSHIEMAKYVTSHQ